MVWLYETIDSKTGEIVKVYSKHCISSFKGTCKKNYIYLSWYGYIDVYGTLRKVS